MSVDADKSGELLDALEAHGEPGVVVGRVVDGKAGLVNIV